MSSLWVSLVTPVPASLARPLVDSLIHEVVCGEHDIAEFVPDPDDGLIGFDRAIELALAKIARRRTGQRRVGPARTTRR